MDIDSHIIFLKNIAIRNNLLEKCSYSSISAYQFLFGYYLINKFQISYTEDDINNSFLFNLSINRTYIHSLMPKNNLREFDRLQYTKNDKIYKNNLKIFHDFANFLLNFKDDIICVSLTTYEHQILLIYRKCENIIEIYDPNGGTEPDKERIVSFISILRNKLPPFRYICSEELHHDIEEHTGLQIQASGSTEDAGYCQIWSYLISDLVYRYRHIPTRDIIYKYILKSLAFNTIRESSRHLKLVVRGFYHYVLNKLKLDNNLLLFNFSFTTKSNRETLKLGDEYAIKQYDYTENFITEVLKNNILLDR